MTAQESPEFDLAALVASRARGLLAERQMKQAELGLAMGITRSRISDRLNGVKAFEINEVRALARALNTSVAPTWRDTPTSRKSRSSPRKRDMLPLMQPATGDSLINNIRAEMARRRVDQGDIARLLGLSRNAVSDRLRGRSRIQLDELQAIATFLQVPLEQLLAPADAEVPA